MAPPHAALEDQRAASELPTRRSRPPAFRGGLAALLLLATAAPLLHADGVARAGRAAAPLPPGIAQRHPIDGTFDFAKLPTVPRTATLAWLDGLGLGGPSGDSTTLRYVLLHDDRHLYVALEWDDASWNNGFDYVNGPHDFDGVKLAFDEEGDGQFGAGEDARTVIAASIGSMAIDQHAATGDETDAIGDGQAALQRDAAAQLWRAEFLVPLDDDANGEDGTLSGATRFTLALFDHVELLQLTGRIALLDTSAPFLGADSSSWRRLPLHALRPHRHPELPRGLTGLIAFVSRHESPQGDLYTFDPATRLVTRVTNDPTTYKDNVSLSRDRKRVAFHAAPAIDRVNDYEIWTANVDGTALTQRTSNSLLDGHPAWSPDGREIAYVSFRNGSARIVRMDLAGNELAVLTPDGADDNDPEWLLDGRITFKTDRFSVQPEVRMAVMDADGSNVQQLTFVDGVSDHDPVAVGDRILFERFLKDTWYTLDVEAGFTPWDLVEARLDGSGERTLLHDRWINWLPVADPSGRFVAHLKSVGYTELRLMTRTGRDLGRLLPGITQVSYFDWK